METATLTSAYQHARNASQEYLKSNGSGASNEHEHAASDFALAAKDTDNAEALRILRLLEDHHVRLAGIIKSQTQTTSKPPTNTNTEPNSPEATSPPADASTNSPPQITPAATKSSPPAPLSPTYTRTTRKPRELSSSIVSSLATARGKPGPTQRYGAAASPEVSRHNAGGRITSRLEKLNSAERQLSPESRRKATQASQTILEESSEFKEQPKPRQSSDDGFNRFFSTFSPIISALTAPLAFAGLPLTAEDSSQTGSNQPTPTPPKPHRHPTRVRATDDPEVSHLFSKAALRSLKEDAHSSGPFGQESFYVVPPSGGTMSYATMASRHVGDEHGKHPDTIEEETDEFVDARENLGPPSPTVSKHSTSSSGRHKQPARLTSGKTNEELHTENSALKKNIDELSKRLVLWEASSQRQTMAMTQSFASISPLVHATGEEAGMHPIAAPTRSKPRASQADNDKLKQLEKQLEAMRKEREEMLKMSEKQVRENEKLQAYLGRYREKWEGLKKGAKERRERERVKDSVVGEESEGVGSGKS